MMALLRRCAPVDCDEKYVKKYSIRPKAMIVACGNEDEPIKGDRTWVKITTNNTSVNDVLSVLEEKKDTETIEYVRNAKERIPYELAHKLSQEDIDKILTLTSSANTNSEYDKLNKIEFSRDLYEMLQEAKGSGVVFDCFSLNNLFNALGYSKEDKNKYKNICHRCACSLRAKGYVKQITRSSDVLYVKWDMSAFKDLPEEAFFVQGIEDDDLFGILNTRKEFDRIINLLCGDEPDPKKEEPIYDTPETDEAKTLTTTLTKDTLKVEKGKVDEPKHSYADLGSCCPFSPNATNEAADEFETINPLSGDGHRSHNNPISMRNFLFEMDETPLEEQKEIFKELYDKGIVNRGVFSGNKSIHMRITVKQDIEDERVYKLVHKYLNGIIFNGKADRQTNTPAHGTRKPNGVRKSYGSAKQLLLGSPKSTVIDAFCLIDKANREIEANELLAEFKKTNITTTYTKPDKSITEWVESWKDGDWKDACIDICNGVGDWYNLHGFLSTLARVGYTYEEVMNEIPQVSKTGGNHIWQVTGEYYNSLVEKAT